MTGTNNLQSTIEYADSQALGAIGLLRHRWNGTTDKATFDYRGAQGDPGYCADGTLRYAQETVNGVSHTWRWDYNYEGSLQYEQLDGTTTNFGYDTGGNITSWGNSSGWVYSYNQLTRIPNKDWDYTYNNNGERLSWRRSTNETWTYSYNVWGDLTQATSTSGDSYYAGYDGFGRRAWQKVNGTKRYFLYDGDTLIAELNANGNLVAEYTWGLLGPLMRRPSNVNNIRYYIQDGLGHTRALLDNAGNVTDWYVYDAWGGLNNSLSSTPTANPFRWNGAYGYEWIPITGLYHVGAREYDPRVGRWLQRDPVDIEGGDPNLYRYCLNDPVNEFDPDGLDWLTDLANFVAGWGDALTGGLTDTIRDWISEKTNNLGQGEHPDIVDPCGDAYRWGSAVGEVHDLALGGRGKVAKQALKQGKKKASTQASRAVKKQVAKDAGQLSARGKKVRFARSASDEMRKYGLTREQIIEELEKQKWKPAKKGRQRIFIGNLQVIVEDTGDEIVIVHIGPRTRQ